MVFNAIDSPDVVSSSKQPKYVTLEYCFISIPLRIILSFPAFFNLSFEPRSMHFVLSSPRWILNLLSTNHSCKLAKSLIYWCSILWTSLCWNVRPESFAYKSKLEWTAWGISLTYSKNKSGLKIDPWGMPQEILDKSNKWVFTLTLNAWSFFFNWDSLHARRNSHYEARSYKKKSTKKITRYRKSVQKEPTVKWCLLILDLSH